MRNAFIGFVASIISDIISNFMRVIKTYKQSLYQNGKERLTYLHVVRMILSEGGIASLFGRGSSSPVPRKLFFQTTMIILSVLWMCCIFII